MRKIALSLLAHPDDAEFLCAGTLARLRELDWEVHIVSATAGDCGSITHDADEISRIRLGEGKAAAELIGANYHCLGEKDLRVVYCREAIQRAIDLFRDVAPSLVFSHPRLDYMLDHEQTHLLARCASFGYAAPNASSRPVRPGSAVPHLYYCDPLEASNPYSGEVVEPTTVVDISEVIETKVAMLAAHASQREWLRAHHGTDEYIDAMRRHSQMRGKSLGVDFAEAFRLHPGHPYPQNDLLKELLG